MLERSPYPLLSLKLLGSVCPCLERDGDGPARRAAWATSSMPVRWHRRLRGDGGAASSDGGAASAVGGFISGMFGGGSSASGGGGGGSYDPVEGATLSVADSATGPQLVVSPPSGSGVRAKRIPLKAIKNVRARKGGIISSASRSGIEVLDCAGREVLRFDVLKSAATTPGDEEWENERGEARGGGLEDAEESTRDDVIDQLQILMEWERRRQAYLVTLGEDEADNDEQTHVEEYDDENGETPASPRGSKKKGAIAEKAQKIKHFAQREIELQKMKKDRENRKAKYVKEAGGLKYTAIAMANRS
ncbi:hypothetical protein ACHAWF_014751 [Thalassiosira exigua]